MNKESACAAMPALLAEVRALRGRLQAGAQVPDVLTWIDTFCDLWPAAEYGPAHLVLSHYNVSNYDIGYCLGCCDYYNQATWGDHSPDEIAATRTFLIELLQVAETVRLDTAEAGGY